MSVRDLIRPVGSHCIGIPKIIMDGLNYMARTGEYTPKQMELAVQCYEMCLHRIRMGMAGHCALPEDADADMKEKAVTQEQELADIVAHMIIDCAAIHNCIAATGYQIGPFPYDDLVDAILPKKEKVV